MKNMVPKVNQDDEHIIENISCFALDMDGTVYLGKSGLTVQGNFWQKLRNRRDS